MRAEDFEMFQESIEGVYAFYGKDCSRFALDVWWQALKVYDLRAIQDALGRHCVNPDNGQFMPRPADVVRMMEGSTLDSAVQAWTKIERAISSVGTYQTVVFDDPLIHRVILDMGGWSSFGQKSVDEWPFVGKEFQTRYRGYKSRREVPDYPPKLLGMHDAENVQHGFESQKPVMIGNPVIARQVSDKGKDTPLLTITETA